MNKIEKNHQKKMYSLYFDGASKGNPGPSGYGGVFYNEEMQEIYKYSGMCQGHQTNNFAEYTALVKGLEYALNNNMKELKVYGDSKLVVEQFNQNWKVKSENLKDLYLQAQTFRKKFNTVSCHHVRREYNKKADALANEFMKDDNFK